MRFFYNFVAHTDVAEEVWLNNIKISVWMLFAVAFSLTLSISIAKLGAQAEVAPTALASQTFSVESSVEALNEATSSGSVAQKTDRVIKRLGYTRSQLAKLGILVQGHDGSIKKECPGTSGRTYISGVAIKSDVTYPTCDNGKLIIPKSFQNPGYCTVHFNVANADLAKTDTGNSTAIFAHELGHCFYFVYGEYKELQYKYLELRPELIKKDVREVREIFAEDYMICHHQANTGWQVGGYYDSFSVLPPGKVTCEKLNRLIATHFPS